jgi:hypothetical protein
MVRYPTDRSAVVRYTRELHGLSIPRALKVNWKRVGLQVLKIAGIQSVNEIRTGTVSYGASGGGCAWEEMVDASIKRKKEAANYRQEG